MALLTTTGRHLLIFSARPSSRPLPEKMLTVSVVSSAQRRHRAAVMARVGGSSSSAGQLVCY